MNETDQQRAPGLPRDTIALAYRLFLGRNPTADEAGRMQDAVASEPDLRRVFLNSAEFAGLFRVLAKAPHAAQPRTVIHLHIPKSAGTTLTAVLAQVAGPAPGQSLTINDHGREALTAMPLPARRQLRFVFGHLSHGIGRLLPQDSLYICVLRRPVPRIFSLYHYIRRTADHPAHDAVSGGNLTFGQFLDYFAGRRNIRLEVDNGQIRRIAGMATLNGLGREDEIFDRALGNIFAPDMVFGLTEHFDDFLGRLKRRGIIRRYDGERRNVAPEPLDLDAALAELSPPQRQLLTDLTVWDDRFYDICKSAYFSHAPAPEDRP